MAGLTATTDSRRVDLKLAHGTDGATMITARVPLQCSEEDFIQVGRAAYGLINKLTGCHCASGRVSFVVEDIYADVIRVELGEAGQRTR